MGLSDGHSMTEEKNTEEPTISVGNKRKKKKQDTMPRPACSWVHFSREFIKEYSASHPESSGLKAATKAASDAWKSMSVEEKAKYTKRAREVWDNYLSSTPARVPKPRRQAKLITRCSPGRLFNVIQRLTPEQQEAVKTMGFGSLLDLRCRTLRRSLCLWLLERFNPARSNLNLCGERIPLSPRDVEMVLGLAATGKDVVNSGPDDSIIELRRSYGATNRGISLRFLEDKLASPGVGDDFKRSFVLYALGTLLCPTARLDVSPSFLHFLTDMEVIHQYNWGKFLLDRLIREVSRFRQGKQRAVGGCLLFLQLFYYEKIPLGGPSEAASTIVPFLSLWGEEEITEREKREKQLGGYGRGEVIYMERHYKVEPIKKCQPVRIPAEEVTLGPLCKPDAAFACRKDLAKKDQQSGRTGSEEQNMPAKQDKGNAVCEQVGLAAHPTRAQCRNEEYGCTETMEYMDKKNHEEMCIYAPCSCPFHGCSFVGSSKQLSLHFSGKHWDSGRRFQYNSPLSISISKYDQSLVLQAEEDGRLFLLNKGLENIGQTVMITCIGPRSSQEGFFYDLVAEKGVSSHRLKSWTESFPGRVVGVPPVDFLLIPFGYLIPTGQLNLEMCIWNSTEPGAD